MLTEFLNLTHAGIKFKNIFQSKWVLPANLSQSKNSCSTKPGRFHFNSKSIYFSPNPFEKTYPLFQIQTRKSPGSASFPSFRFFCSWSLGITFSAQFADRTKHQITFHYLRPAWQLGKCLSKGEPNPPHMLRSSSVNVCIVAGIGRPVRPNWTGTGFDRLFRVRVGSVFFCVLVLKKGTVMEIFCLNLKKDVIQCENFLKSCKIFLKWNFYIFTLLTCLHNNSPQCA